MLLKIKKIVSKKNRSKIICLTAYSKNVASILDNHCDIILVGDSLGSVLYNYPTTRKVNLNTMIEHSKSVKKGIKKSLMVVDMPYRTYRNPKEALSNAKKIISYENLDNLALKVKISEGLIDINETKISWLDTVDFKISDSLIYMNNNNLILDALITIQINNYNELYKYFQTPRNYRKEIKKVQFNLRYNFDQYTANLNDIKIDGLIDQNVNKTLKQLNIKDNKLKNRIYFKNLINQAIKFYAG